MARDLLSNREEAARALADLRARRLNFDPRTARPADRAQRWKIDDYRQPLPTEAPGPPAEGGSWEVACRLLREYDFVDPSIVRAAYRAGEPLEGRTMLLELRLWGLRFHVGVRVGEVTEGVLAEDGRSAVAWGWSYRTLEGHFEVGQMDYAVLKWPASGEVEFRIHAYSRVAHISNPFLRLGFRLIGRRKQTQYARRACERMRRLTEAELRGGAPRGDDVAGIAFRPREVALAS